jgi:hypothetical protein
MLTPGMISHPLNSMRKRIEPETMFLPIIQRYPLCESTCVGRSESLYKWIALCSIAHTRQVHVSKWVEGVQVAIAFKVINAREVIGKVRIQRDTL